MEIKQVFDNAENGTLTYEQFEAAVKEAKAKFVDLSEGKYVSVNKYNDELKAKATEIDTLNNTISTRDTDLATLKQQLADAGADATKLQEVTDSLAALQGKYDDDTKAYKNQLKKQAYEFAVKEFANGKKFTSKAAKQYFIQSMINEDLKMDKDGNIMGADDYVTSFSKDYSDTFVVENPDGNNGGNDGQGAGGTTLPHFIGSTPGGQGGNSGSNGTGPFNFSFTGVRPMPTNNN